MAFLLQPGIARLDPPGLVLDAAGAALQRAQRLAAARLALGFLGRKRIAK